MLLFNFAFHVPFVDPLKFWEQQSKRLFLKAFSALCDEVD
jgi:hypothetical protein